MSTEQQYASPELCRRMVELGAPWESANNWSLDRDDGQWHLDPDRMSCAVRHIPAYDITELLAMFPDVCLRRYTNVKRHVFYTAAEHPAWEKSSKTAIGDTAADALAKLYIALHPTKQTA